MRVPSDLKLKTFTDETFMVEQSILNQTTTKGHEYLLNYQQLYHEARRGGAGGVVGSIAGETGNKK